METISSSMSMLERFVIAVIAVIAVIGNDSP
jgi:hypothetical protein